ncbi:MAG: hypothetical protein KA257_13925 [Opitutaceae bacterium]|nr:hypothetical protein [Opitutaceae bacterium]MBP9913222.1 hypothetical protein [Opitutaceae bacterium]
MILLAATTMEKVNQVPLHFWFKAAGIVALFVIGVLALRKAAGMNKAILGGIVFILLTVVGFHWVYERNEPAWATPVVEKLAGFFPSKGSYANKQGH